LISKCSILALLNFLDNTQTRNIKLTKNKLLWLVKQTTNPTLIRLIMLGVMVARCPDLARTFRFFFLRSQNSFKHLNYRKFSIGLQAILRFMENNLLYLACIKFIIGLDYLPGWDGEIWVSCPRTTGSSKATSSWVICVRDWWWLWHQFSPIPWTEPQPFAWCRWTLLILNLPGPYHC
jgi:hypothetical protein